MEHPTRDWMIQEFGTVLSEESFPLTLTLSPQGDRELNERY
jgi:hypothetical protein